MFTLVSGDMGEGLLTMVMRKLSAILQDLLSDPDKLRAAADRLAPEDERTPTVKADAELPGCTGGVTSEPPTEDTAATFPGSVKRNRSSDQWVVRPPVIKRGRIRPKESAAPAFWMRPRLVANDNHGRRHFLSGSPSTEPSGRRNITLLPPNS